MKQYNPRTVDCVWNVMANAQKPDFVFRRNGRVHLNRQGASVQSTTGSRGVRISDSNAGYTMFRGSMKSTGYPLHSPVSPLLPLPCVTVCHHRLGSYLGRNLNIWYIFGSKFGDLVHILFEIWRLSSYLVLNLKIWFICGSKLDYGNATAAILEDWDLFVFQTAVILAGIFRI